MLYFAYGSNLNHHQMKNIRCFGSKFINFIYLKNYKLIFSHPNKLNKFGYANVVKNKGSKVAGAIWKITRDHEIILDGYEQFPDIYQKEYFLLNGKKIMFYIMKKYILKSPPKVYVETINKGYEDCNLDKKYLTNALKEIT
mgnify:FL=1|tara:strand:+ start:798 stop:1220 length:423 start_codon:yes stop_codon:yes gene_type:complete